MRFSKIYKRLCKFPTVIDSLSGEDLFRFVTVASHVIHKNQNSIKFDKNNAPHEYLYNALPPPSTPGTWEVLWTILYSTMKTSYVDADASIYEHGIPRDRDDTTLDIVQRVFWPPYQKACPNEDCQKVRGNRKLERRVALHGYLFDLDGVKSVRHHTTHCRGE